MSPSTLVYTSLALLAFAGNSVLCRLALAGQNIDAASFSAIRLLSGAVALVLLLWFKQGTKQVVRATIKVKAGIALLVYMLAFSYAYIKLDTATGALILFATVQLSMLLFGLFKGAKLHNLEYMGLFLAMCGLLYLLLPSASAPDVSAFLLMSLAGVAWAAFTLIGKGSCHALADTGIAFLLALPAAVVWWLFVVNQIAFNELGLLLAIVSGAVTSGLGYYLWYQVLPVLALSQAAALQLLVPVLAALGGVLFGGENVTSGLLASGFMILGGISLTTYAQALTARSH